MWLAILNFFSKLIPLVKEGALAFGGAVIGTLLQKNKQLEADNAQKDANAEIVKEITDIHNNAGSISDDILLGQSEANDGTPKI